MQLLVGAGGIGGDVDSQEILATNGSSGSASTFHQLVPTHYKRWWRRRWTIRVPAAGVRNSIRFIRWKWWFWWWCNEHRVAVVLREQLPIPANTWCKYSNMVIMAGGGASGTNNGGGGGGGAGAAGR